MEVSVFHPGDPGWNSEVDRIGRIAGAPDNARLFPYHFLQATLPRLGGHLVTAREDDRYVGAGCLLPRLAEGEAADQRAYTLRFHTATDFDEARQKLLITKAAGQLQGGAVFYYDPQAPHKYAPTHHDYGVVNIGRPDADEAAEIRSIHQRIWGSAAEFLYPSDIHSESFDLGTSLIARVEDRPAGFIFGFYKYGGPRLPLDWQIRLQGHQRLESQTMGVDSEFRGMRIGFLLKKVQADLAQKNGIRIINWTTDPLLYANAALNFGLLRAIAFDYYADLYPFRNELNRVHASRFGLTWLIGTRRVDDVALYGARPFIVNLDNRPEIPRVNRGLTEINFTLNAPLIAIEIPADWTHLQQEALPEAQAWRETTDRIFGHYIGLDPGKYVITDVGTAGDRRFLIGQQVCQELWQSLHAD
jgi:predicted GNAT superfamily acetyltransferase